MAKHDANGKRVMEVDLRGFRLSKLNTPEYSYLKWLLYWPIYMFCFSILERGWIRPYYHPTYCIVDDWIPFCEWFVLPYMIWFVFVFFSIFYTALYEREVFVKTMKYVAFTYTIALIVFVVYPNCQELRPETFARDNVLTRFMALFYQFDTNTNVLPSVHVLGTLASLAAYLHCEKFQGIGWKIALWVLSILICVSTVFLKQHSILDMVAAIPVCIVGYALFFQKKKSSAKSNTEK